MAQLHKPIINTNSKTSDIYVHLCWFVVAYDLRHEARDLHRVDAASRFNLRDFSALPPSNGSAVCAHAGRVYADD